MGSLIFAIIAPSCDDAVPKLCPLIVSCDPLPERTAYAEDSPAYKRILMANLTRYSNSPVARLFETLRLWTMGSWTLGSWAAGSWTAKLWTLDWTAESEAGYPYTA